MWKHTIPSCFQWMCQNHQLLNMGCSQTLALLVVLICTFFALTFALGRRPALAGEQNGEINWRVHCRIYHLPSGCRRHPSSHENFSATLVRGEQKGERRSLSVGPITVEYSISIIPGRHQTSEYYTLTSIMLEKHSKNTSEVLSRN